MTKLTKLALEQINAKLATENEALRKQVLDLQKDLEIARANEAAEFDAPAPRAQHHAPAPRTQYVAPAWQAERAANMARAKEAAMAMRCVVKV